MTPLEALAAHIERDARSVEVLSAPQNTYALSILARLVIDCAIRRVDAEQLDGLNGIDLNARARENLHHAVALYRARRP